MRLYKSNAIPSMTPVFLTVSYRERVTLCLCATSDWSTVRWPALTFRREMFRRISVLPFAHALDVVLRDELAYRRWSLPRDSSPRTPHVNCRRRVVITNDRFVIKRDVYITNATCFLVDQTASSGPLTRRSPRRPRDAGCVSTCTAV